MDNIVNMGQNDVMSNFTKTDDIMNDMRKIIEGSQKTAGGFYGESAAAAER